jgi:NADPH:quinone reductase-like Zn-dependent oxidoreductase
MSSLPRVTRAILIERHGPPEVLVEREVPLAPLGPYSLRLKVEAAGVNFADLLQRVGLYGTVPPLPYAPGFEVAGVVEEAGPGVEGNGWKVGDRAVALLRYGGYAREVVVAARQAFRYPAILSPVQAAAVPVVFLTAWVALFEAARARAGETVLILGAGGGVGTAAVQLAVEGRLKVIGTAGSQHKRDFVTSELGAIACFDSLGDWEFEVRRRFGERGIDVALDSVGGRATRSCRRLLAPLGRLVFYGLSEALPGTRRSWPDAALAFLRTAWIHPRSLIEPNLGVFGVHLLHLKEREEMLRPAAEDIYRRIAAGELKPIVDRTFPLTRDGAVAAHHYLHARKNLGKVVLEATD